MILVLLTTWNFQSHENQTSPRTVVLGFVLPAEAQLTVVVSPPRITGTKAMVPLSISNGLSEKVESARAAVFLVDQDGKMIAQGTQWVIGGDKDKTGLAAGATNIFHFVVTTDKPITTTNLTAKVNINRVVLEGGKLADLRRDVNVLPAVR